MTRIIIGKVSWAAEGNDDDDCYCNHKKGEFYINNVDYIDDLVRTQGIKYLVFNEKPGILVEDGEYNEFSREYEELKNFITENILLDLHAERDEVTYTGRCCSEWTCGEGEVTLDVVRCEEIANLKGKYIFLIL